MNILSIVGMAFALAMDAFAVSITSGVVIKRLKVRHAVRIALFFGGFQAVMPLVGWLAGTGLKGFIGGFEFEFTLLMVAVALVVSGGGRLSVDYEILGWGAPPGRHIDLEEINDNDEIGTDEVEEPQEAEKVEEAEGEAEAEK